MRFFVGVKNWTKGPTRQALYGRARRQHVMTEDEEKKWRARKDSNL
jgi:hypothetical protein